MRARIVKRPGSSHRRCKLGEVKEPSEAAVDPSVEDIDADGVDRAQIREMLALTPAQRLQRVEDFVNVAIEIRNLNGARTPWPWRSPAESRSGFLGFPR